LEGEDEMRTWTKFLNNDQIDWVADKLQPYKDRLVVVSLHGSMLYGLEREGSDVDVKAVYLPSFEDLLLGESIKTKNIKDVNLNIEIEIKSLPSFLKSCKSCDTNCIDMLWTPDEMIMNWTSIWEDIRSHRKDLLSKNMKGLIGYIKKHTHTYSNKIQRYQEMSTLLEEVNYVEDNVKLSDTTLPEIIKRNSFKYVKFVTQVTDHEQQYLEVCGKKYILSWECKLLKEALKKELDRYGKRSKDGDKKGMDSKSLSHALRVLLQLKELIETKNITFPLVNSDYIKKVKLGEVESEKEVIDTIDELFEEVMMLLDLSDLPEDSNIDNMMKRLVNYYK
jgi:predicted nucleotidyltransferase|tara:strand:- start:8718 stop:9722 length:1005 start_codon:yes stop_codon:yes gene_type:complete